MNKAYILHSGIKGQRWGIRRYQNEDGTLTPAGKIRYGSGGEKEGIEDLERDYKIADAKAAKAVLDSSSSSINTVNNLANNLGKNKSRLVNEKDYSNLSDAEIKARISRLQSEKTYGELTGDVKKMRSAEDWTREILQTIGATVAVGASLASMILTIREIRLGGKGDGGKKIEIKKGGS